jgi:hypothetical protein
MAYIGSIPAYQASGVRPRDEFTADGTQICFPLSQSVPGSFESGVTIILDNVPQQPVEAFTVVDTRTLTLTSISGTFTVNETVTGGTSAATGTVLKVNLNNIIIRGLTGTFNSSETITGGSSSATATTTSVTINTGSGILFSEAPTAASVIYVVHEGNATYNLVPTAASVGPSQLADNLRNFTVDTFTGDGTTTAFTLSDTPSSANSLLVMVDGIVQTRTTNYTLSSAVVTFTDAPDSSAAITIIHLGFSTISRTGLVDGSVTTAKIADNAITSAKLGFDVIVAEDIAANAITVSEIQNGAVTPAKLSTGGLYWDTSSNVGIGTSSPSTQLQMNSGSTTYSDQLRIRNTNYGNADIGVGNGIMALATDMSNITFYTSSSLGTTGSTVPSNERVRIDGSGNVGIGTDSPAFASGTGLEVQRSGDATVRVERTGATNSAGEFVASSGLVKIGATSGSPLVFITDNTERLRIPSNAGGITFPATMNASSDANTLDDYEEGTWTATYDSGTIISQNCTYTKIGRVVHVLFQIQFNAVGTSLGRIGGMPFNVATQNYSGTHSREWYNTGNSVQCITSVGSSFIDLFFYNGTRGVSNGSGYGVSGTITYNT